MCSIVIPACAASDAAPLAHTVAQRRGKLRVIEDANPDRVENFRHSCGVAHRGKRPGHHHPVVTGQHAGDPIVIALRERPCHLALDSFGTGGRCYPLFGSGSAGLGMRQVRNAMPPTIADWLVFFVALVHVSISIIEMFFWNKPFFHERLGLKDEEARKVAPIVANAGLYNGFLAAGLLWGLLCHGDSAAIKVFFLTCAIVAGIFGAVTLSWKDTGIVDLASCSSPAICLGV
jgi:putative membrane protein